MITLALTEVISISLSASSAVVEATYADRDGTSFAEGRQRTTVTTPATVVAAPTAGVRLVKNIYIRPAADLTVTVTVGGSVLIAKALSSGVTTDLLTDGAMGLVTTAQVVGLDAALASMVHLAGAETITGAKTFALQIASTLATGTAPISVASTTVCPNLNSSLLNGKTFADPGAIGGTTPGAGTFTDGVFAGSVPGTPNAGQVLIGGGAINCGAGAKFGGAIRGLSFGFVNGSSSWDIGGVGSDIVVYNNNSAQTALQINGASGAATFASSVAALGFNVGVNQVVGARGAAVADATDAATAITQLNLALARMRAHGLIAA